jgi:transglutaminase-like putative cysteine protease
VASRQQNNRRADIARAAGFKVVAGEPVLVGGVLRPSFDIVTSSNEEIIQLLNLWGASDAAEDDAVKDIAKKFATWAARVPGEAVDRARALAQRIHRYVRDHIAFQVEAEEVNRESNVTLTLAMGDCDDQSVLVKALANASGLESTIHGLKNKRGEITHACATVRVGDRDEWVETTIAATFGEPPFEAAVRLGLMSRADITG